MYVVQAWSACVRTRPQLPMPVHDVMTACPNVRKGHDGQIIQASRGQQVPHQKMESRWLDHPLAKLHSKYLGLWMQ